MLSHSKLLIDEPARHVRRVLINRPEKRNAIDHEVREQMIAALERLSGEGEVRALLLGGVGGIFSAGGDLPSMTGLSASQARQRMQHIARLCRAVHALRIPVVTAMQHHCVGACVGLALLGDVVVVGESTRISLPFLKLGLAPDWGLLYSLPRRVGLRAARGLCLSDEALMGSEALRIGLADELAADAEVMPAAVRRAARLALLPGEAFGRMKQRLNAPSASLDEELSREAEDQAALLTAEEFREGFAALMDKRSADFTRPRGGTR